MAEIIRKTEATFFGPWLLDSAALTALDEIIDEQWPRLEAYKRRTIKNAVQRKQYRRNKSDSDSEYSEAEEIRQRMANDYPDDERTITLTLASGNKVRVRHFREAVDDVNCQSAKVTKVEVRLRCAGITGELVVPTSDKTGGLSLLALPEASEQADELFIKLHRWTEQYKPDWFRRIRSNPVSAIIPIVALCVALIVSLFLSGWYRQSWKDEVGELVARGVKPEDNSRALELLLQESARLPSYYGEFDTPPWFAAIVFIGIVIAVVLSVLLSVGRTTTAFEIGKGVPSVRWQKGYDRFLRFSVPAFLVFGFLASMLASWVYDFIRSFG